MALSCEKHKVELYDRGGLTKLGDLTPVVKVKYERRRDDVSVATVHIGSFGSGCGEALGLIEAGRAEIVIFRGKERVWEGPISRVSYRGATIEVEAKDVMYYVSRTTIHGEYDNRHPRVTTVLDRLSRMMPAELARKEACDPPYNIVPHLQFFYSNSPDVSDSRTAAHTKPYQMSLFDHIDNYAARGGLDYVVIGRRILLFDVHTRIGQTPMVTGADFIGDPVITQYGAELATAVAMTDGKGHYGEYGGIDPYYGEWEVLHQAYDENAQSSTNPQDPPSVAELRSQAQRAQKQGRTPPLVVRIPDNTRLNPNGVLQISDLVPGIWIPLTASLPGRSVSQMQKLDSMTVEETPEGGEIIQVTLSPAYTDTVVDGPAQ
ncbi:MAG TPA: hypothetical protein VF885_14540 [Arthrobacter sp.]